MGEEKVLRLSKGIEDLSIEIDEYPPQDGTLEALSRLIEQIPNLKRLELHAQCEGTLSIKSSSLENIDFTHNNSNQLKVTECICPSLQTFQLACYSKNGSNNGVQLAVSHDIRIEDSERTIYPVSEWDFVGMEEVPKSCIVKVERRRRWSLVGRGRNAFSLAQRQAPWASSPEDDGVTISLARRHNEKI